MNAAFSALSAVSTRAFTTITPISSGAVLVSNGIDVPPCPEIVSADGSPKRPPGVFCSPECMSARRKVPVVTTTARADS